MKKTIHFGAFWGFPPYVWFNTQLVLFIPPSTSCRARARAKSAPNRTTKVAQLQGRLQKHRNHH